MSEYEFVQFETLEQGLYSVTESYDYSTLPILIKLSVGKKVRYFFNTRPYGSFLLQKVTKVEAYLDSPKHTFKGNNYLKNYEFGIMSGLGASYQFKTPISLSLELRNNFGVSDLIISPFDKDATLKSNSFNLLVGIKSSRTDKTIH